jgi:hypothetical protein
MGSIGNFMENFRVETTTCRKMESDFCMEDAVKEFVDLQLSE